MIIWEDDAKWKVYSLIILKKYEYKYSLVITIKEEERMLILRVTAIQKTVRGWIHRIQFKQMKAAAVIIEKYWRGYVQRQRYHQVFSDSELINLYQI